MVGTGLSYLSETINFLKIASSLKFKKFLIMPPAYYKYEDKEVIKFYSKLIESVPQREIILYNFEKLCGNKYSTDCIKKLVKEFPSQIVGVKDSSYNLYDKLEIDNFSIFPGSELKLLDGLKLGCSGIITATCNVTSELSRKVMMIFWVIDQIHNQKLFDVRKIFDRYNLISGLHTFYSQDNEIYRNILPPLRLLKDFEKKDLLDNLKNLNFTFKSQIAAWYAIGKFFKQNF